MITAGPSVIPPGSSPRLGNTTEMESESLAACTADSADFDVRYRVAFWCKKRSDDLFVHAGCSLADHCMNLKTFCHFGTCSNKSFGSSPRPSALPVNEADIS